MDGNGQIAAANAAFEAAARLAGAMTGHLADAVAVGDRVNVDALDARQVDAYDLAVLLSRLQAARSIIDFAARRPKPLHVAWAGAFIAEIVSDLAGVLMYRGADWGIDDATVRAELTNPEVAAFVRGALAPTAWAQMSAWLVESPAPDYGLDDEHEHIRKEFRRFSDTAVAPLAERVHKHDELIPEEIITAVSELGCFGLSIPERFGGLQPDDNPDNLGMVVVTEELSRGSLGVAGSLITRPEILSKALLKGGTDEQREHWLPLLASGETLCAVAVTEPDYGSDVAGLKVMATPHADGWLLNGQKTWCTFAGYADVLMVLARSDPDPAKGHRGLTIFLAEKPRFDGHAFEHTQEGGGKITARAIDTLGYRGMHSFDVFFEDYFVPDSHVLGGLGGVGKGFYYQMEGFAGGRLQTAARACGVMQAALDTAIGYATERKVFGLPVASYQLSAWKLARMGMLLQTARQFTYDCCALLDGHKGQVEASMVKLWASRIAEWVTREAMQLHGGMGYAEEYDVSRYFVDARVFSIFEGAEEVLALRVVARQVLQRWLDERKALS
ncbi:MAG: acyl-CoA dehydrogenase [Deltaproteobacteria bacterium HGW-Deltaproteobacteria-14]|jgi:(2S)-methylsuccinyl-CoA dehydrogenase|nr:MAG: acyl-CoA dehydrogenase [Deltaproteobacteria bacterium HGW-Deltaproteobacteria-14]